MEGVEGGGVGGEGAGGGRFDEHKVSKPKPWMEMVWPFEKKQSEVVILGTESTQPVTGYAEGHAGLSKENNLTPHPIPNKHTQLIPPPPQAVDHESYM